MCIATGSSARSRTPCRRRCSQPAKDSRASSDAPRSAPGCTALRPTAAWTRCDPRAAARKATDRSSPTCRNPGASARSPGSSHYPDVLLDGVTDNPPGPQARYEARDAISLAFRRSSAEPLVRSHKSPGSGWSPRRRGGRPSARRRWSPFRARAGAPTCRPRCPSCREDRPGVYVGSATGRRARALREWSGQAKPPVLVMACASPALGRVAALTGIVRHCRLLGRSADDSWLACYAGSRAASSAGVTVLILAASIHWLPNGSPRRPPRSP